MCVQPPARVSRIAQGTAASPVMNDEQLIIAVVGGDSTALRALFEQHAPWLAARLRRVLPAEVVEDVLQETFIGVWRGAKQYKGEAALGAWIWGIARRQAALWARKHGQREIAWAPEAVEDPVSIATFKVDLDRALDTVGPVGGEQRELARLLFVEDRPVADVAQALGIPEGTVKSRAYKLRRLLRAALGRGEG